MPTNRHIHLDFEQDGIATLTINVEGSRKNFLSTDVVDEMIHALQRLHSTKEISGLLIRSTKTGFFSAGMPLSEILGAEDAAKAMERYQWGGEMMNLLQSLPCPSVAVIDGLCRSGGLELALACTYRVASEGSHVSFSIPDLGVGLLPGWGGTQRLPRIIGLYRAVDLLRSGRTLSTKEAFALGLVDDYTASEIVEDLARGWLSEALSIRRPSTLPFSKRVIEWLPYIRTFDLRAIRTEITSETKGIYPAPVALIDLLEETYRSNNPFRFELEAKKAGELATTPVAKSLLKTSLAAENILKTRFSALAKPVSKVGVIGAGRMGSALAHLFSKAGKTVRLRDLSTKTLAESLSRISKWNDGEPEQVERLQRIAPTTDWTGLKQADFVIERVIENAEIKKEVLAEAARHLAPETVLASTTSTLSIVELAEPLPHPERFIGLHFFHPARENRLVEVVPIATTSDQTIATVFALAAKLGKTPVLVSDFPGFLVNRVLALFWIEALRAVEEGAPLSEVENAVRSFGFEKGPFEMMDELGLDFVEELLAVLHRTFDHVPEGGTLVGALRTQGRLGKKNGRGFYTYSRGKKRLEDSLFAHSGRKTPSEKPEDRYADLIDRLVLVQVNEAVRCLEEKVVFSVQDLEVAMVLGGGFPRFRGGPLAYASAQGLRSVSDRLQALSEKHGQHFRPTKTLSELAQIDGKFN